MKKALFTLALSLSILFTFSQSVQRSYVVVEIGTGTWCTYCPGAANGAHDLIAYGQQVAVIENHNGDAFANTYSNARNTYYGITGYPTAFFDGTGSLVGGAACPNGNVYASYLALYNTAYAVASPLVIDIAGTNTGNTYNITLSILKLSTISSTDLKVHLVLTETNIPTAPWPSAGCMHQVDYVTRLMAPDENGTDISFTSGDFQVVNLSFTKESSWVTGECELVAFVQSDGAKTIYNSMKVALTALPPPITVDFTGTPTSGCAPVITNFTGTAPGANTWQWNFPGGSPGTSAVQNPTVTYTTTGTNDVTLSAWDAATARGNTITKSDYISVIAAPGAGTMPQGDNGMCINPADVTYTTTSITGATSYTWDLTPPAAGVISPSGTSCTVNFEDTWTGTAELKVRGSNSCGDGDWSPSLEITVSEQPTDPGTPTGPDQLCMNAPDTDYTTTGASPTTSYTWELLPYEAGSLYPSGNTCTIDWVDTYAGTATLRVKALNGACESNWSDYLTITVNPGPTAFTVTGGGPYCGQGGSGSPVGLDDSETGVDYTLYLDGTPTTTVVPGTGSAISFGDQMSAGEYTVEGSNTAAGCDNFMLNSVIVTIDPELPAIPDDPTGPVEVYTGDTPTSEYNTEPATYATSYTWELTPAAAGNIDGAGTMGTVTWDLTYSGPAEVKVQSVNSCGGSTFSASLEITVEVGSVGLPELTGKQSVRLYPNPARNRITIIAEKAGKADLLVFNSFGRKVLDMKNLDLSAPQQIDVSRLASGIYFVKVNLASGEVSLKLIIE
ncbi:MAG: T9SS type A sorting domain-containing protein [Bacteroidales bacterium]|nr:T9SS type A sorting domain-containing protein [Bacteroidales bacterium]